MIANYVLLLAMKSSRILIPFFLLPNPGSFIRKKRRTMHGQHQPLTAVQNTFPIINIHLTFLIEEGETDGFLMKNKHTGRSDG
ncbi:hypothetical protein TNCT_149151 [Trichonephila clavata]|uniref:Uncharacterized protein n=1 Tax=Trichonephila clavata TaxID=2740835 RepID=A0A8X6FNZ1_TRICU|nr:hypothetical protein TNCT_149151 [Trichonephila clavata]